MRGGTRGRGKDEVVRRRVPHLDGRLGTIPHLDRRPYTISHLDDIQVPDWIHTILNVYHVIVIKGTDNLGKARRDEWRAGKRG